MTQKMKKIKRNEIDWNVIKKQIYTDGEKGSYLIDFFALSMAVL